jgi:hypothetical protein
MSPEAGIFFARLTVFDFEAAAPFAVLAAIFFAVFGFEAASAI